MDKIKFPIFQMMRKTKLKDFTDILNSTVTPIIISVFVTVTCFKSYVISPISCYASTVPPGSGFDDYMKAFCWTHGTVIFPDHRVPTTDKDWNAPGIKRIAYYQWIPFLLCIQMAFFYLPNLLWRLACHNSHGTDLVIILEKAKKLAEGVDDCKLYDQILGSLEDLLFVHRDYRHGVMSKLRRKMHKKCGLLTISKRLGTSLSISYIGVKMLYIINGVCQLVLMNYFLDFDFWNGGAYTMISSVIKTGDDWKESPYFPRSSFCRITDIRSIVGANTYVVQCALPINMLNEKIFIFLFLWVPIVVCLTLLSLFCWIYSISYKTSQVRQVKGYLKMRQNYKKMDKLIIEKFVQQFLRHDGIFLLLMIRRQAGDVVTSTIVNGLYRTYYQKYRYQDFNNDKPADEVLSLSLKLEPGGKGSVKNISKKPSAPEDKIFL